MVLQLKIGIATKSQIYSRNIEGPLWDTKCKPTKEIINRTKQI